MSVSEKDTASEKDAAKGTKADASLENLMDKVKKPVHHVPMLLRYFGDPAVAVGGSACCDVCASPELRAA